MQKDFSYPLAVDDLSSAENKYTIKADKQELIALKELMKVPVVNSFEADFKVKLERKKHLLSIKGNIKAIVELESVISLDVFTKKYNSDFTLVFDTSLTKNTSSEEEFDFDDEIIENVVDGKVDLWQIAIEQFALLIDDYPKKDGETFSFASEFSEEDKKNPFDVLAKLKK